ncbi:MAG: alpha-amylase [Candidatus Omnitrophica bacterium]|nr:alpha-amylase [Candidatus Omnitrophota bacterium]
MRRFNRTDFSHHFPFGIPILGEVWDRLELPDLLETVEKSSGGQQDVSYSRGLSFRLNNSADPELRPQEPVRGASLLAFSLISDVFRYLIHHYCHRQRPGTVARALGIVSEAEGEGTIQKVLQSHLQYYPPVAVRMEGEKEANYLEGDWNGCSNRDDVVKETILLSLQMSNPAVRPMVPLFDDKEFAEATSYQAFIARLEEFFDTEPPVGGLGTTLFGTLRAPILASPNSLQGQWDYIARNWASILPDDLAQKLTLVGDMLREEERMRGWGPPEAHVLTFGKGQDLSDLYPEYERYSRDEDWMSNVVLIAKSTYVWLDQLSKQYGRNIHRLDQIPDEELEKLSRWGVTGLWLIGVWERSQASRRIKQIRGNPEALASAYSLWDYLIADELGGEEAYQDLARRAWEKGIRLASDMVPNHVGIDSKWVHEHPDWFVQLDYPPYPNYQFTGENLSTNPGVGVYIEDGYWESRDAAVTFKRVDFGSGQERHIYHGNDGTHMPWNDTAQLNYLNPEVREAVIQTILHVARKFPIIRFDAAMTLAKKHFQRLWYPQPGHGGDIPSRAERGMTRQEFDSLMPQEFWREVVDRVAVEAPGTLLLAEAFWLMEGYFVRTLGMHRVYNSAFMHMLKNEDNGKYRQSIRNVLEFSPQILKRFVNFMNNPDEDTAVAQFGKGDKYFGVAMTMVTMPGLPMIGHGQIEGYGEKYGMEFRKAYWDERVDEELVRRHQAEIFPLMRKRYIFAGHENFALYDLTTPEGHVNENVLAYSNRFGDERALIIYNNSFYQTRGTIHTSTEINVGSQEQAHLVRKSLSEALGLKYDSQHFYILHDHKSHMEQLFPGQKIAQEGFYVELNGYQYHAFLGFQEIRDTDGTWWRLHESLNGQAVPSIKQAYMEMLLEPVLAPFENLLYLSAELCRNKRDSKAKASDLEAQIQSNLDRFWEGLESRGYTKVEGAPAGEALCESLSLNLPLVEETDIKSTELEELGTPKAVQTASAAHQLCKWVVDSFAPEKEIEDQTWFESLYLDRRIQKVLVDHGLSDHEAWRVTQIFLLMLFECEGEDSIEECAPALLESKRGQVLVQAHQYDGHIWFRQEDFQDLFKWLYFWADLDDAASIRDFQEKWEERRHQMKALFQTAEMANYRFDKLLDLLKGEGEDLAEVSEKSPADSETPQEPPNTPE